MTGHEHHNRQQNFDWLLWSSITLISIGYIAYFLLKEDIMSVHYFGTFAHTMFEFMNITWWSLLLGIVFVGLLGIIPKELIIGILGRGGTISGIARAILAGILFDVCSHGILMVGMKLYERGASVGQMMAFLIASPWNSISLTIILIALIGWKLTLLFFFFSIIIAFISGLLFEWFVAKEILPSNPNSPNLPSDFSFLPALKESFRAKQFSWKAIKEISLNALQESRLVLRWIFFGFVLAGLIRAFIPVEVFSNYFGPSLMGLFLTLIFATIIEVCSEGSTPIATDLVTRAAAPGNAFTFLMAGVSTDYTEIMSIKERTRSWKIALFLPLVTLPQVVLLGWLINMYS